MTAATITVIDRATVARINEEHQACQDAYGDALAHAIRAGRLLADVKAQLRHGEFMPWLADHFDGSERTARVYMQLAAAPEVANRQTSADLSIAGALKQISEPRPKRATASDAGALLRGLGGGDTRQLAHSTGRPTAPEQAPAWSDQQARKHGRALADLTTVQHTLERMGPSLSPFANAELAREAEAQTRKLASALSDLAFSFEK